MLIVVTVTVLFLFSSTVSLKFGFQSAGSSRKFGDSFASNVFFDTQKSVIYINGETSKFFRVASRTFLIFMHFTHVGNLNRLVFLGSFIPIR